MASDAGDLARRIDVIESSYEYLLAYAAQGRQEDRGTEARVKLQSMYDVLGGLAAEARSVIPGTAAASHDVTAFLDALERDAAVARGAIGLVLGRPAIASLLVDNLNASVHLRALLTDLFLIEQSLRQPPSQPAGSTEK